MVREDIHAFIPERYIFLKNQYAVPQCLLGKKSQKKQNILYYELYCILIEDF